MTQSDGSGGVRGWYHGWNVVAATMVSQVAGLSLTYNVFSLFVQDWSRDLHASVSQMMLPLAAMVSVCAALAPWVGSLADRLPARRLFGAGLFGIGLFYIAVSVATQTWQVIALYAFLGAPSLTLCSSVTANALISRWFTRRVGLAFGLSAFGIGFGGVLLPPLVAVLLPEFGWRMIWRGTGLLVAFVLMPVVVLVIRDRPEEQGSNDYLTAPGNAAGAHHGNAHGDGQPGWRNVVSHRNFWLLIAIYLPIMGVGGACTQNIAPYSAAHQLPERSAGILLAVLSFSHVIATVVLGMLIDRFGSQRPLAGLALAVGIGTTILAIDGSLPAIAVGAALIGLASSVFTALAAAILAEFGSQGFGRAFGLATLFQPLGTSFAFVMARANEATGSYVLPLIGCTALMLLSCILCLMLRLPRGYGAERRFERITPPGSVTDKI